MRTENGNTVRLEDYRPSDYLIPEVKLVFQLHPTDTMVSAQLTIIRREIVDTDTPLILSGDGLHLEELAIDGQVWPAESYQADGSELCIKSLELKTRFVVAMTLKLSPSTNSALMGLYQSNGIFCTQCEAEGFRRICYFLDRPDVLSIYHVRIEALKADAPVLLSNGNKVKDGDLEDGWHFCEWNDPHPKPSYLFALVAGTLELAADKFVTASGRPVDLGIYVEPGKLSKTAYAMDSLKRSMLWDEITFDREYDLDVFNIVAVSDFNMGAMENKGLNIFNDKYVLADPETATDADYANIEAIIAHEYFHNWTGNRITCRDWFQLCLKEGLTVYRDHEFSADQRSRAVRRIAEVRALRSHQFAEDAGPLAHPVRPRLYREINNFYTATVYEKGSEVVRMIRTIVGDEAFRDGMNLYFERHDGQAVTIEDFLQAFQDTTPVDLSQFALWYHQAGTPNLSVNSSYDQSRQEFVLEIEQSMQPTPGDRRKRLMHIPIAFGLVGPDGEDMPVENGSGAEIRDGVIHLRRRRHVIRFRGVEHPPVVSLLRGFSAPVTVASNQAPESLRFLAAHDNDTFSRWQALNNLASTALQENYRLVLGDRPHSFDAELTALYGTIALDEELEPAYRALALSLPSEMDIARELGENVDPEAIHRSRQAMLQDIAALNREVFSRLHGSLKEGQGFDAGAESAGIRALRNQLLDYLSADEQSPVLAFDQFSHSTNMTDMAAALTILVHRFSGSKETVSALKEFEMRFSDNPIVLDKWFSIQATVPGRQSLDIVRQLLRHPAFTHENPNRLRSLVGAFATGNQTGFNQADGSGYQLLGEIITRVDRSNPQIAARLATAYRSWKSLEPARREEARKILAGLAENSGLSRDLRDIIDRSLA